MERLSFKKTLNLKIIHLFMYTKKNNGKDTTKGAPNWTLFT